MQITRSGIDTQKGPGDWFTGEVYIDAVAGGRPSHGCGRRRALHPRRPHGLAHPPARPDHLRHRGRRPVPRAAARSRRSGPATASSSSPARTTGTGPRRTASWSTSPSTRTTRPGRPPSAGASTSPTSSTPPRRRPRERHGTPTPGTTGVSVSKLCLGAMMFGAWGNPDHDECIRDHPPRARRRDQLHRHRRRLLARASRRRSSARRSPAAAATTSCSPPRSTADGRRPEPAAATRAAGSSARSRTPCGGSAPTGSTSTRSTGPTRTPTSTRRSARSPTSCAQGKVRYIGSSTFPAEPDRRGAVGRRATAAASGSSCEQPPYSILVARRSRPTCCRRAQRYGMGVIPWSPLAGGWLSGR